MKLLTTAAVLLAAATAGGCAFHRYDDNDARRVALATPNAAENPTVVVAEGNNGATPYTQRSFFFHDRGLHLEDPSTLAPKIVEPVPRG